MRTFLALSLATVLACVLTSASPVIRPQETPVVLTAQKDDVSDYRLGDQVVPSHYDITLNPDLPNWAFDGHVIIHVEATVANVQEIVLHANILTIKSIKVYHKDTPEVDLHEGREFSHDEVTHKLTIPLTASLDVGQEYRVEIAYSGEMRDDMAGFYRSTYKENGVEKRLGSTQFQTTSARRAFPCFDEPRFKATFDLKFIRNNQYKTIANTKLQETKTLADGLFEDVYKTTPKMSTYLIAFIVSEYEGREDDGKTFGVWARPEMFANTEMALTAGLKLLAYFNTYTGANYYDYMEKMDMAGIPDFEAGAMENWGLLTYRESLSLYNKDKSTTLAKQRTTNIISHEQAHMWFGDLVSLVVPYL